MHKEDRRRMELKFKKNNLCPECHGSKFLGSELDHYPCDRCKATGKYVSETSIKSHPTLKGKVVVEKGGKIIGAQG